MPFLAPIIASIGTWWAGTAIGSFLATIGLTGKVLLTIGLNIAAALIQRALVKKPQGGVQFERQYGADVPRTVAIGKVGLAGHDCYINTFGSSNKFLQQIYVIADYPCDSLSRVGINGEWRTLGAEDPDKGFVVTSGEFANLIWVKFFPGTHTTANDYLVNNANPAARWTANHIGRGVCFVLVSMTYDQKKNASFPDFFFEVNGAKLYDWRKDSTAGGSGAHRWNLPETHEFSENPIVADYNYRRGFSVNGDLFCGMGMPAADLPLDKYTIAANICDEVVDSHARYRVSMFFEAMQPHGDNIETVMLSCGGIVVDGVAGSWPIVGTDQPVVATIYDDDLIAGAPVNFQAKRSMAELVNSVAGNYPNPEEYWSMVGYEPQIDTAAVIADRRTRDLNLDFPQVPYVGQAEQLASIYLEENRYEASATITVRPRFQGLEPGDWIIWDSARYGARTFMIVESSLYALESDGPRNVLLTLQERDGSIYDGVPPSTPVVPEPPGTPDLLNEVESFALEAVILEGDTGTRRPAIRASWGGILDTTVDQVEVKYYPTAEPTAIFTKMVPADQVSVLLIDGIVRNTEYRVQTRIHTVPQRTTVFSAGLLITSPDVGIGGPDIDDDPPGVPTGLAMSSANDTNSPGYAILTVSWNANDPGDGVVYYDLNIKEGAGNYVSYQLSTTSRTFRILSGTEIDAKVRAVDGFGLASAFSTVVEHTVALDTTPPAVPTGLSATGGFNVIWLKWNPNTEPDLAYYEIYQSDTSTPAPVAGTAPTFTSASNQFVIAGLADEVTKHYWIRARDISGNKSAWTARVQATTSVAAIVDLTGAIDLTAFAAGITPVEIVAALPATGNYEGRTVFLTTDNKIYRHTGSPTNASGFTKATDGADIIANSITAGAIAVGAIGAQQIASDAISARHLLISDTNNLVPDDQMQDALAWSVGSGWTFAPTSGGGFKSKGVAYYANQSTTGYSLPISCKQFAVEGGQEYYFAGQSFSTAVYGYWYRVHWFDGAGALISFVTIESNNAFPATLNNHAINLTAPSGAKSAALFGYVNRDFQTSTVQVGSFQAIKRNAGKLLVDGSIFANHLTTGELITLSAQIKDAIITSAKIVTLDAAKIQAGSILSGELIIGGRSIGGLASTDVVMNDMSQDMTCVFGTAVGSSYSTAAVYVATGTRSLVVGDTGQSHWTAIGDLIPFDPSKLYKMTIKVRRSTTTGGTFLAGVHGLAGDKTTHISTAGPGAIQQGHWVVSSGIAQTSLPTVLTDYVGWFKGHAATGTSNGTIAVPAKMHDDVRYIQPIIACNASAAAGAGGIIIIDSIKIETIDENGASLVNAGTVKILPGLIEISGSTTLGDWRQGGDVTKIAGGAISANTISANKIVVGARGVTLENIEFEHNSPSANRVSWTAGNIRYINDAGSVAVAAISANAAGTLWSSGVIYIYWVKGATSLSTTTTPATAFGDNNIVLATYQGGVNLVSDYGRTIIDGSNIKTGTITATQLITTAAIITAAAQIQNAVITSAKLNDLQVTKL
jgi:hypothetical protein